MDPLCVLEMLAEDAFCPFIPLRDLLKRFRMTSVSVIFVPMVRLGWGCYGESLEEEKVMATARQVITSFID